MIDSLLVLIVLAAPPAGVAHESVPERSSAPAEQPRPEQRALAWLTREVPRWHREHACFSCHHNGDAARVLYSLQDRGRSVDPDVLADTTAWLARPGQWKHNHGDERFSDQTLANLQFAAALAAANEAGAIEDSQTLVAAAELLAADQQPDGTWKVGAPGTIGSPITWGPFLTMALARDVLVRADHRRFAANIARIDRYVRAAKPRTVLDAAGCLLALGGTGDEDAVRQREACLKVIRAAAAADGGLGPYRNAPLEPFDTAIVLLALQEVPTENRPDDFDVLIEEGRKYLERTQQPDGSWLETTRPADRESYAHRVSTTAWALLALVMTDERRRDTPAR